MKSCVLRFFYGEITKCSVHDKKFVKPKQYVCFQLFFFCFPTAFSLAFTFAHSEMFFNTVARDVPGGKRILIIKINAQHNALSKAIKTRFKIEIIYCDVSS